MRVTIASDGNNVSGHFGHCEGFKVYEVEGEKIISESFVENPGHRPGFLPQFLNDIGASIIIACGMGERAQQLFNENNINVIVGARGYCGDVMKCFLDGTLVSTGSVCREHEHEGNCGE
ncbi:NifB/NifX family molybdenum-iron cluster-binding protein [Oceanirhabdus sp. W0125-5]|uniref:NifB/NifX family molybdenum-iron cluster-binding protein n=1 Tax=Oceanirhabdus sp. W0125-5 TaxID=2999116 RepID=UPI0022F2CD07|nr:NifB/NifX family molybdenum-iron cluster-binding protein [Oceanirhabdus sp. W0125-5]WBW96923.1 NifB/NifX family molybdenum-iron cluster-binding protein [Oceanirhabdus sp. W0125-5]